jgi:hypothetical protein
MSQDVLGVFVKHPVPGQVKTRLATALGDQRAAELYASFLADIVERFRTVGQRRFLCYTPSDQSTVDYFLPLAGKNYELWPQSDGSLGVRMTAFFDKFLGATSARAVIIGSDSPTLPRELVEQAFERLKERDCVLGPAVDGGFYLVGQRECSRPVFESVAWSSPRALEQTVAQITTVGARLGVLQPWYDIDTPEDLEFLRGHVRALQIAGEAVELEATLPLLSRN